jgi:phosphate transport system permease protein
MSGILLAFGRAIGDAASVYFTAGYSDYVPTALSDSAASLPTMIYALYNSPMLVDRQRAYAAAFVLLMIVLVTSIISRYIGKRYTRYIIK